MRHVIGPALLVGLLLAGCGPSDTDFNRQATYRLPPHEGTQRHVKEVGHFDGDDQLDILARVDNVHGHAVAYDIYEVDGDSVVVRHRIRDTENARDALAADVDGDGVVEIAHGNHQGMFKVLEPRGEGWEEVFAVEVGVYLDYLEWGDTDGDGRLEYLLAMESEPAELLIWEATGPDSYTHEATLPAADPGYAEPSPPLLGDLDGDGRPELVFGRKTFRNVYVFNWRELERADGEVAAFGVGDTDGDGVDEIVGSHHDRIRVLAAPSRADSFTVVLDQPQDGYRIQVHDLDGDGRAEFFRPDTQAFTLARREGDRLVPFFSTGRDLQRWEGNPHRLRPFSGGQSGTGFWIQQGEGLLHFYDLDPGDG